MASHVPQTLSLAGPSSASGFILQLSTPQEQMQTQTQAKAQQATKRRRVEESTAASSSGVGIYKLGEHARHSCTLSRRILTPNVDHESGYYVRTDMVSTYQLGLTRLLFPRYAHNSPESRGTPRECARSSKRAGRTSRRRKPRTRHSPNKSRSSARPARRWPRTRLIRLGRTKNR